MGTCRCHCVGRVRWKRADAESGAAFIISRGGFVGERIGRRPQVNSCPSSHKGNKTAIVHLNEKFVIRSRPFAGGFDFLTHVLAAIHCTVTPPPRRQVFHLEAVQSPSWSWLHCSCKRSKFVYLDGFGGGSEHRSTQNWGGIASHKRKHKKTLKDPIIKFNRQSAILVWNRHFGKIQRFKLFKKKSALYDSFTDQRQFWCRSWHVPKSLENHCLNLNRKSAILVWSSHFRMNSRTLVRKYCLLFGQ